MIALWTAVTAGVGVYGMYRRRIEKLEAYMALEQDVSEV